MDFPRGNQNNNWVSSSDEAGLVSDSQQSSLRNVCVCGRKGWWKTFWGDFTSTLLTEREMCNNGDLEPFWLSTLFSFHDTTILTGRGQRTAIRVQLWFAQSSSARLKNPADVNQPEESVWPPLFICLWACSGGESPASVASSNRSNIKAPTKNNRPLSSSCFLKEGYMSLCAGVSSWTQRNKYRRLPLICHPQIFSPPPFSLRPISSPSLLLLSSLAQHVHTRRPYNNYTIRDSQDECGHKPPPKKNDEWPLLFLFKLLRVLFSFFHFVLWLFSKYLLGVLAARRPDDFQTLRMLVGCFCFFFKLFRQAGRIQVQTSIQTIIQKPIDDGITGRRIIETKQKKSSNIRRSLLCRDYVSNWTRPPPPPPIRQRRRYKEYNLG